MSADNSFSGSAVCRVCLCGEASIPYMGKRGGEPLISPCHCKGTMGLYHKSCLEHWLYISRTTHCEICNFRFQYGTKSQSICAYFRVRGWNDKGLRSLPADYFSVTTFSPLAGLMVYYCIKSAKETMQNNPDAGLPGDCIVMLSLAFMVTSTIIAWYALTTLFHFQQFRHWQAHHKLVFIIDQLEQTRLQAPSKLSKLTEMLCCCASNENDRLRMTIGDMDINPRMISPGGSSHSSSSPSSGSSSDSSPTSSSTGTSSGSSDNSFEHARSADVCPLATFRPSGNRLQPHLLMSSPHPSPSEFRDDSRIYDIPPDDESFSEIDLNSPQPPPPPHRLPLSLPETLL